MDSDGIRRVNTVRIRHLVRSLEIVEGCTNTCDLTGIVTYDKAKVHRMLDHSLLQYRKADSNVIENIVENYGDPLYEGLRKYSFWTNFSISVLREQNRYSTLKMNLMELSQRYISAVSYISESSDSLPFTYDFSSRVASKFGSINLFNATNPSLLSSSQYILLNADSFRSDLLVEEGYFVDIVGSRFNSLQISFVLIAVGPSLFLFIFAIVSLLPSIIALARWQVSSICASI